MSSSSLRETPLGHGEEQFGYLWATLTLNPRRGSMDSPGFRVLVLETGLGHQSCFWKLGWVTSPGVKARRTITLLGSVLAEARRTIVAAI